MAIINSFQLSIISIYLLLNQVYLQIFFSSLTFFLVQVYMCFNIVSCFKPIWKIDDIYNTNTNIVFLLKKPCYI